MKKTLLLKLAFVCAAAAFFPIAPSHAKPEDTQVAVLLHLAPVPAPDQTLRVAPHAVPAEVEAALEAIIEAGGPKIERGHSEVLAWMGPTYKRSRVPQVKKQLIASLKKTGWTYEESEPEADSPDFTMVSVMREEPKRQALIGFWVETDDALMLAWTEMLAASSRKPAPAKIGASKPSSAPTRSAAATPAGAKVINVSPDEYVVNAMKGTNPKIPDFPALARKPKTVRGYVKDHNGKPLQGAVIGVRSSGVGGAQTSATGKTDARGYYEILVPWGAAGFYAAGYSVDWGDGRAPLGLRPADGTADEFATPQGHVENWVLFPYGIASRSDVQDNPKYLNAYFGGSVTLTFHDENSMYQVKKIPFGSVVEITFTPRGKMIDGTTAPTIIVRKTLRDGGEHRLYVNNLPIAPYKISAKLAQGGQALLMKETGPEGGKAFGISPKEARGSAELMFRPYNSRTEGVTASNGHWSAVDIDISG